MPLPGNKGPISAEKALLRLETQCAASEQCEREVLDKMRRWGLAGSDAMRVLESLKSRKFIDNERYARAFVRDKYRFQRWGRRKIAYALSVKGVDRQQIDAAMEGIDEAEYEEILSGLLQVRARMMGEEAQTYEGRTRLFRMAASRGYEPGLVAELLRKMSRGGC